MIRLEIDRRQLLKMGLSTGLLATLPMGCVRLSDEEASALFDFVGNSDLPVDPERTGELSQEGFDVLAGLCEFVNRGWELESDLGPYLARLQSDLRIKTTQRPSYLAEYLEAVKLVESLTRSSETLDQAWAALLFSDIESEAPDATKLGHARRFVFAEIVTHQVALSGGFKSFGVRNYSGHFGGSFLDEGSYRRGRT
jgi:hypothetical protein